MTDASAYARSLHTVVEPLHNVLYLVQDARDAYAAAGLEPFNQGYIAARAAPLGAVGPGTTTAAFSNFHPSLHAAAVPSAWDIVPPEQMLELRAGIVEAIFERVGAPTDGVGEAQELASSSWSGVSMHGRPLASANACVPPPSTPFAGLWQSLAVLREYRGDGHLALLTTDDVHPVEAMVLYVAWQDLVSRRFLQRSRAWDDEAWNAATARVQERGWIDADGALTDEGRAWRDDLERRTDRLAAAPFANLGEGGSRRLFDLLAAVLASLTDAEIFPRRPDDPHWF